MLLGNGDAADAKRRLLERAGAVIVGEESTAMLAIVAIDRPDDAAAAVMRLRDRGILVNAVDRPALCDFTLPALVDRAPVLIAIGTGGASAGLAAALRQRLEQMLPAGLGRLADALHASRAALRTRFPDGGDRRRALGSALAPGGLLDPLTDDRDAVVPGWLVQPDMPGQRLEKLFVSGDDPDELTLRQARLLGQADRLYVVGAIAAAILDRARADADRLNGPAPAVLLPGLSVQVEIAA